MSDKKYDVGIYGLWYGRNYGSIITYYALNEVVKSFGYTTAMIKNPLGREGLDLSKLTRSHSLVFADKHYDITPLMGIDHMAGLNEICDRFLLGSDQMWNYGLSRPYKQTYFFDFVRDDKVKVAYATSFGKEKYNGPEEDKGITGKNLKRMDAISVRDDFSKEICEKTFGVPATINLDPVFLCEKKKYEELVDTVSLNLHDFIFAYILDPNPEIGKSLKEIAKESGKKVVVIFNEGGDREAYRRALEAEGDEFVFLMEATVEEWLYCFKNSDFVITDSFHGSCFSIIFEKPFIVRRNSGRGGNRFDFLLGQLGLKQYMVSTPAGFVELFKKLGLNHIIDYSAAKNVLQESKKASLLWLKQALEKKPVKAAGTLSAEKNVVTAMEPVKLHPDIERAKMVVALVKEYGIKHIVVSSGARNVVLVKLFEADSFFRTYNVTDERSAAYFAMGISLRTKEPVVITCTSGTAVSNYLPGVTEAFYQKVPLVIISGDRYPCYLGQMEPQMIQQYGLFRDVCKKSVNLPIYYDTPKGKWEAYRMVCEALLEVNHHGAGPVHINFPIDKLENQFPNEEAKILPHIPRITRVDPYSDKTEWEEMVAKLKNAKRIMLICGQNNPLSEEEKHYFDLFTEKYNCVVLTDHIANVDGKWCLNPYRLLKRWKNDEFKRRLMPEIAIYIGGKRTLNCPLQGKMRSIVKRIDFWHVIEDGSVADIYGKLTKIVECKQSQFFKYFATNAGENRNDGEYFNLWKGYCDSVPPVDFSKLKFTSYYTMGKCALNLPKNSLLHLGVGNTFINIENYPIDPSVDVYCNMGTNGIDGSASTFIGQCTVSNRKGFLLIGDLSFFYDMNAIWNKQMNGNVRILLNNDGGAGLLAHYQAPGITQAHNAVAEGWVKSLGFKYLSAHTQKEFDEKLDEFLNGESSQPVFFEVFVSRS